MRATIELDRDALGFLIVFGYYDAGDVRLTLAEGAVDVVPELVTKVLEHAASTSESADRQGGDE